MLKFEEFGNRVDNASYDLQFTEDTTMYHSKCNTLDALVSKDHRVGRGLCQLQRHHSDRYGTLGIPPRPTGVKRPDRTLPLRDRIAFGVLSTYLTGIRGVGYYDEYLTGPKHVDNGVPQVDERNQ